MIFELPNVASAAAIDLDITQHGLELTVSDSSPGILLPRITLATCTWYFLHQARLSFPRA
jgi:hypothetical protein